VSSSTSSTDGPERIVVRPRRSPHGLDGSFHVTRPRAELLPPGAVVEVGGASREVVRRAGTVCEADPAPGPAARTAKPPWRSRGEELRVARADAPSLEPGEYLAEELEGCRVHDGEVAVGVVPCGLICAAPPARRSRSPGRATATCSLPLVHDAVRAVDPDARRIDVDLRFSRRHLMDVDVFTLFPEAFDWFVGQRHVRNAAAVGLRLECVSYRDHTALSGGQVDDTPFGGGAGMVLRVDVVDAALRARYGRDPVELHGQRRFVALTPGGRMLDEELGLGARGRAGPDAAVRAL